MDSDLQTAKDLRAAADYLRVHGKLSGKGMTGFGEDGGPRCVIGAIGSVVPECEPVFMFDGTGNFSRAARRYALVLGFSTEGDVYAWSDASTLEEVVDRLESVALNLEIRALATADKPVEVPVPA